MSDLTTYRINYKAARESIVPLLTDNEIATVVKAALRSDTRLQAIADAWRECRDSVSRAKWTTLMNLLDALTEEDE